MNTKDINNIKSNFTINMVKYYADMNLLENFFKLNQSLTNGVKAGYTDLVEEKYHSKYLELSQSILEIEKDFLKIRTQIRKSDSILIGDELKNLKKIIKKDCSTLDLMSLISSKFRTQPEMPSKEEMEKRMKKIEEISKARGIK